MRDLTASETVELEAEVVEFVRNRALDGVHCVVVVYGRGFQKVGYAEQSKSMSLPLLEWAEANIRDRAMRSAN